MGKPVSLNRFRKEKARAEKKARADENAVKFGQTKTEKLRIDKQLQDAERHHDGHKRGDT